MRVTVPYTHIDPNVRVALRGAGHPVTWYPVGSADDQYWRMLRFRWELGETFCVVEHDVVVWPDTIDVLEDCPSDWCSFEISYAGVYYAGLGCAKFSASLLARHPDALDAIADISDATHPPKHWCRLDSWLSSYLEAHGETKCVHRPALGHIRGGRVITGRDYSIRPSHEACR